MLQGVFTLLIKLCKSSEENIKILYENKIFLELLKMEAIENSGVLDLFVKLL